MTPPVTEIPLMAAVVAVVEREREWTRLRVTTLVAPVVAAEWLIPITTTAAVTAVLLSEWIVF